MIDYKKYIKKMKREGKGLMSIGQYLYIAEELYSRSPCNLLVFGLGHDSYLWDLINTEGRTVFIEDDDDWIEEIGNGSLEIHSIKYSTKVSEWESINFDEDKLKLDLPSKIKNIEWDFVIIDAPLGHSPPRPYKGPGRMSTIYNGYKLLKNGGVGVVDDMGRVVEREYAYHYFGKENLDKLVEKKVGVFIKNE